MLPCNQSRVANCTTATFQMNHHMIWIGSILLYSLKGVVLLKNTKWSNGQGASTWDVQASSIDRYPILSLLWAAAWRQQEEPAGDIPGHAGHETRLGYSTSLASGGNKNICCGIHCNKQIADTKMKGGADPRATSYGGFKGTYTFLSLFFSLAT